MATERRAGDFIERLSFMLVVGAFVGGYLVLFDLKITLTFWGQVISIGSGFAAETKGMVLQSMLISGFAAVVAFWLGTTKQGQDQAVAVSKIAEGSAPATALAVAASRSEPLPPVAPATAPVVTPAPATTDGVIPAAEVAKETPK